MTRPVYDKLYNIVVNKHSKNPIAQHFLKTWFNPGDKIETSDGTPDIAGYTMIYLKPPALSGLGGLEAAYTQSSKNFVFLAQEFTPPDTQIINNDISSTVNIKIPYGVGKSAGGQLTISFLENISLDIFAFHHSWYHYIEQVILGELEPAPKYILGNILDYATSAYIMKYKPDLTSLTYIGKAVGLFPTTIPVKELIGARNNHQTTIFTVPYICTDYWDVVLKGDGSFDPVSPNCPIANWVIDDFKNDVFQLFSSGIAGADSFGLGNILGAVTNPLTSIINGVGNAISSVTGTISGVVNSIGSVVNIAKSAVSGVINSATNVISSNSANISNIVNSGNSIINGNAISATNSITSQVSSSINNFKVM